jgi:hypothetical protein
VVGSQGKNDLSMLTDMPKYWNHHKLARILDLCVACRGVHYLFVGSNNYMVKILAQRSFQFLCAQTPITFLQVPSEFVDKKKIGFLYQRDLFL